MREGVAVLLGKTLGLPGSIIIDTGNQNYLGAIVAGGLHLGDGCALGHADHGLDAQLRGGQSDALCVVAGGAGDDTVRSLLRRQGADLVISAANLECAGELQVFGFDVNVLAKTVGILQRRFPGNALQRLLCLLDHFQSNHKYPLLHLCFRNHSLFYCHCTVDTADLQYTIPPKALRGNNHFAQTARQRRTFYCQMRTICVFCEIESYCFPIFLLVLMPAFPAKSPLKIG